MDQSVPGTLCRAVGVSFEGRQAAVCQLQAGQALLLVRDHTNVHDPYAIAIYSVGNSSAPLGYIGRDQNHMGVFESLLKCIVLAPVVLVCGDLYYGYRTPFSSFHYASFICGSPGIGAISINL